MQRFGILSNRKRASIALAHSCVFLAIAVHGFASSKAGVIHGSSGRADLILVAIYFVVATILAWLVTLSRCVQERVYFALCASSATLGMLRTLFGDATLSLSQPLRVLALASAVAVGLSISRSFSPPKSNADFTALPGSSPERSPAGGD
jgi:hypothetical protein